MTQSSCKRDTKSKSHPGAELAPVRIFSCKHPLISLKKSIQSKHYLQFPSIKKTHLISIKNISFQLKNNSKKNRTNKKQQQQQQQNYFLAKVNVF